MSLRKIKFENKEVNKKEFYSSKQAVSLDSVDLNKIVVSNKWKINDKKTSFVTDDDKIYEKYNEIWEVVRNLLKIDFTVSPVRDDIHLVAKLKIFNKINRTTFNNHDIPRERNHYICIPVIDIDSVLKIDKTAYPQAYLEQCKYKLKKRKIVNYIDDEIIDEGSDIDDAIDSHLNFSVPDSYVEI